jgi:hypothetical protein
MLSESTVYQRILRVGESRGVLLRSRESILEIANMRFGTLPEEFAEQLEKIDDRKRLIRMHLASVSAKSWQEILEVE